MDFLHTMSKKHRRSETLCKFHYISVVFRDSFVREIDDKSLNPRDKELPEEKT